MATGQVSTDSVLPGRFDSALVKFDTIPQLQNATWGFCAVDIATGTIWKQSHARTSLIPASTLKPITTAAALMLLGPDYRFKTVVQLSGTTEATGVHQGNLVICGSGDPTLGSDRFGGKTAIDSFFIAVLNELKSRGIQSISGRIIADAPDMGSQPVIPSWQFEDLGYYFGAAPSDINVFENSILFTFYPGKKPGDPAKLASTFPDAPYIAVINQVLTGPKGSGDRVQVTGVPWSNQRILTGSVPAGAKSLSVKGTLPDPPYQIAYMLHNFLAANGINVALPPTNSRLQEWSGEKDTLVSFPVYQYVSPPLKEIVYHINMRSVNLFAEALVGAIGDTLYRHGSTDAGLLGVESFLAGKRVNTAGIRLRDGSGLSRKNLLTTEFLATTLALCTREPWFNDFYSSFPVAGESGSVAGMFQKSPARGNLRAKSGTLEGVKGFCGYATNSGGRKIAYALIINNYTGSQYEVLREMEWLLTLLCASAN
ncbi:MAG TPA: D-alanyl-D-alanine carboxypeptidase/D-alanyl-D-alanine-endopeptidase [Bacteroidales bacterium]|nr:D-alanyl-D-alanine carboxypeptidase/D-alanyl-D-alanine-endopeptidase [Bacteroidales bacterium]